MNTQNQPTHESPTSDVSRADERLKTNLAFASRMLSLDGHDDLNQGQVSARVPRAQRFWIKQALTGFDEARPSDMIVGHIDPALPVNALAPPEISLHQAIYAARPDVTAVIHSHAPHTLVFGATDEELRPLSHDGACFQRRIQRFTQTSHTVVQIEVGRAVAQTLGNGLAVLMRNHGGLVVGKTLREAAILAQLLERACRLQLLARGAAAPYHVSSAEDVALKQAYIYSDTSIKTYWDYCVRKVKRTWPEANTWT